MEGDRPPWRQKIWGESRDGKRIEWTCLLWTHVLVSHLLVHQCGERQVVEQVCEVLPNIGVAVLPQAFVVEAVDLCDLPRLVVPSQDGDSLRETDLHQSTFCTGAKDLD